jgi:uncharacterized RDD family membrane protein YckC
MTGDVYVQSVIDHVPIGLPLRDQIAMELRSHIAERVQAGRPLDGVLRQLGDPLTLAESYLAEVPMQSAALSARFAAKVIDVLAVVGLVLAVAAVLFAVLPREAAVFLPVLCMLSAIFGLIGYTIVAEYRRGGTIGKRLMHIHVVRESGARISLGQALLRQLPFLGQFFFIDAAFAFFTDRRQRAFELLTKTRAVALAFIIVLLAPGMSLAQPSSLEVKAVAERHAGIEVRQTDAKCVAAELATISLESVARAAVRVDGCDQSALFAIVRATIEARVRRLMKRMLWVVRAP